MATRVGPTETRPTHDISLTNNAGTTTVGLRLLNQNNMGENPLQQTSLKMSQGDTNYSDFNLPFTPVSQMDFKGGRAQENFEDDKTRYYDSYQVDTTLGDIRLAPKASLCTGFDVIEAFGDGSQHVDFDTASETAYAASRIVSGQVETWGAMDLYIANRASTDKVVRVAVYSDGGNQPGSVVSGTESSAIIPANTEITTVRFPFTFTVSNSGVVYWIVIIDPDELLDFGVFNGGGNYISWSDDDPPSWETLATGQWAGKQISYRFSTLGTGETKFFEYKGAAYAVVNARGGGAPRLFLNGFRGVCATGSAKENIVAPWISTLDQTGKIAKIISGAGYDQQVNWRKIVATSEAGVYAHRVSPYWDVTPDTTTEVVILGSDEWNEITGHGLTKSVTDICVANGIVYFAQGEATNIRRMREYNSSGTWTREFADDGTNKATFLEPIIATTGKVQVWKVNNPTDGSAPTASYSAVKAWGTALDFTTKPTEITGDWPITVGDATSKTTGIAPYGTPTMPWVMKEDSFGAISNGIWAPVPISEMRSVKSETNGIAVAQYGVYLYFSLLDGLEKYYDNRLDDVGPNRDKGFTSFRRGYVRKIISYPGRVIVMYDAGSYGESCILVQNEGWHEIHRGMIGRSIRDGMVQAIPGETVDRLWFEEGGSIYWLPITTNPESTSGYEYTSTGYIVSSWINGSFREINKFWGALEIFAENLAADINVTAYYQTDVSTTWTALPTVFTTSPSQKVNMTAANTAYGKRWRYKLVLSTSDSTKTPRVTAVTAEGVTRVPMKSTWTLTVYADDAGRDKQGGVETLTAKQLMEQLKTWANSDTTPLPLTMHSNLGMFDDKDVFIEYPRIRPISHSVNGRRQETYVVECNVIECS